METLDKPELTILRPETLQMMRASRKADREHIARELVTIVERHGATITRRDEPRNPGFRGARIHFDFACGGVGAMVEVDDLHDGGARALIHWYNDHSGGRRDVQYFSGRFTSMVGAGFSPRPHHKATSHPNGWYPLAIALDAGLYLAARGEAFAPNPFEN